ncbi:MAG: protein kinase [Planctomycetes bacterium]|nr:protein kinase [Planctomycetota bacterium]
MPNCPACNAAVDEQSLKANRCASCGAALHHTPVDPDTTQTVELSSNITIDVDTEQTLELGDDGVNSIDISINVDDESDPGTPTVALAGEQTIDFSTQESNELAESMATAQWLDNVEGGRDASPDTTIKQKETITGTYVSKSSLVVKYRNLSTPTDKPPLIASATDAPDYELLNVIGEGGMGVVYAARQSAIARTVALKMLRGSSEQTAEQREKFISEAVITGELEHPNIVPIYDLGANESGALFYSMKRVRGTPWNDVIKKKSLAENLSILLAAGDAVAFAHANGVLHRDLKPENIMLGDFGEVLVMDWGLARISADFPNADAVSQSDVMGGTPAYMAPEMATGPIEQVSVASDVYLLGAMLYEIVAGRPPHTGKNIMDCLLAAAKNIIVAAESAGELMDIALTAMATKPADRHQTVQDFQSAIRRYQSHSESIALTDNAASNLAAAQEADDYDLYSRALYGFQEALTLWEGNTRASAQLSAAQVAYAKSALDRSDFDLGISLLDATNDKHRPVLEQLEAGRREREQRIRRFKLLKGLVALLIVSVVGIVSIAYVAVRTQRDMAVKAETEAVAQRDRAVVAEGEAVDQRDRAVVAEAEAKENFKQAESARQAAETQRQRAEKEKDRAEQQRHIAIQAKQAEEYEAYVARIGLASAKIEENAFDRAEELLEQCPPELRHWEWGRLSYLCQLSQKTWTLDGPVESVAYSSDARHFLTGDWDGKARLWDAKTGETRQTITHGQYVHAVAFDPSGKRFATGSSDRSIRIYEVDTGELLHTLVGHNDAVLCVRFSSDGSQLLSGGYDNTARIWDIASGQVLQTLQGHTWWVWAAEFSPDDRRIVTASQDGKAIVWQRAADGDLSQYKMLTEFTKHKGPIYDAKFSPDGKNIATAAYDRRVLLWNPDDVVPVDIARRLDKQSDPPAPFSELSKHEGPVRSVAFSPDGNSVASGGQDNVVRIWHLPSNQESKVLRGHASHVRDCVFSPNSQQLLSASRDGLVKLWQPATYHETITLGNTAGVGHADAVLAARFSRDGRQVVTASRDRTASLWDVADQNLVRQFSEGHSFLASSAHFFADGTRLATGAGDGTTRIWNVTTGTETQKIESTGSTAALDVSADGRWIATGSTGNEAIIWDTRTGERLAVLQGHEATVTALSFAPNGKLLATGDDRGRCRLWRYDAKTKQWTAGHQLRGHSRSITALAFVQGGRRLISASGDNTCGQWDVATGKEIKNLVLKHPGWVAAMDVSEDGTKAITCCDDGQLRLWSLADAKLLQTIAPRENVAFTSVDLSPDGQWILAACAANGTVQLWQTETGREIRSGENEEKAWLEFGRRGGILWAARFAPQGKRVLTVGGNDARMWDLATRDPIMRFSAHGAVASADISPDGRLLVTGSWDQSAKIWNIETGQALRKLTGVHQGYVNSVEFSPDGKSVLTGSDDGTARLWETATGKPLKTVFSGHNSRIRQARFSADGKRVLTAANDKTARIWNAATGESQQTLTGHEWAVLCGEFSNDGQRVITGSEDNTAIIWDASTGQPLVKLTGHTDSITAVAFSADGRRALTGSQDSTAKLWDTHTGKEILTLAGHREELTSVGFSPDNRQALTSSRDGKTILWPATPSNNR